MLALNTASVRDDFLLACKGGLVAICITPFLEPASRIICVQIEPFLPKTWFSDLKLCWLPKWCGLHISQSWVSYD